MDNHKTNLKKYDNSCNKKYNNGRDRTENKNIRDFGYYVLLFFSLAFAGWIWEVSLYLFTRHAFINRGIYKGPYLPIYGAGGLLLCFLLRSLKKKPFLVFVLSVVICSVLEYITSYLLEKRWGVRWWDYSGHFLNINGRICLLGATVFGLGGTALVCFLLPFYERLYSRISRKWRILLCIFLILLFICDATYCTMKPNTGQGISFLPKYADTVRYSTSLNPQQTAQNICVSFCPFHTKTSV